MRVGDKGQRRSGPHQTQSPRTPPGAGGVPHRPLLPDICIKGIVRKNNFYVLLYTIILLIVLYTVMKQLREDTTGLRWDSAANKLHIATE